MYNESLKPNYDPKEWFLSNYNYSGWYEKGDKKAELSEITPKELLDIPPLQLLESDEEELKKGQGLKY